MPTGTSQADAIAYGQQVAKVVGHEKVLVVLHNVAFLAVEKIAMDKANNLLKAYDEATYAQ